MYCSTHNAKEDGSDRHKNRMKKSWHCKATLLLIRRYTQINSYFCYTSLPVTLNSLIRKTFFIAAQIFGKDKKEPQLLHLCLYTLFGTSIFCPKIQKVVTFTGFKNFYDPKIEKSYCSIQHVLI